MNQKWKTSRFNEYLGELDKDSWVIYNNLSGGMLELPRGIFNAVRSGRIDSISKQENLEILKNYSMIVPNTIDEINNLNRIKDKHIEDVTVIGLQVLPTLACPFRCSYCFEDPHAHSKTMTEDVMDAIIRHIENKIKPSTRFFNVLFFGGEPLLSIECIDRLSKRFLNICSENNLKYFASIVTNGYLMGKKTVKTLLDCKIDSCQVTIDGPEHIHNKRRPLKNGGKTWRVIIDNLKYAVSLGMKVSIRMNLDKENINSIEELVDVLRENGLFDKIKFSLGIVSRIGSICRSVEDTLLTLQEANKIINTDAIRILFEQQDKKLARVAPDFFGCVATAHNSVIVGPEGELYKCSKLIGDKTEQCGSIFKLDESHPKFKKWATFSNTKVSSCRECSMLPICNGNGCAYKHIIQGNNIFDCNKKEMHQNYLKHLESFYRQSKHPGDSNKHQKGGIE